MYEIYHRVYPAEQNQAGFIAENYRASKKAPEINVGPYVCVGGEKELEG